MLQKTKEIFDMDHGTEKRKGNNIRGGSIGGSSTALQFSK